MRRTVTAAYLAGLLIALLTGGVAASSSGPVGSPVASPLAEAPLVGAPLTQLSGATARQPAGTVEQVDARLGYLEPDRALTFHYPGAEYVKLHLQQLLLLPGDYLTVSDTTGQEVHRYEADPLFGLGEQKL